MCNGPDVTESGGGSSSGGGCGKTYSVDIQVKAQSSTSCSFCWFVLTIYPDFAGMSSNDMLVFREHLKKKHGLTEQIQH